MRTTDGLTSINPTFERQVRATIPGMAHWAGSGPKNKHCGDCHFLVPRGSLGYGCDKFRQLTGTMVRDDIPRTTRACRYFQQREVRYV